MPQQQEPGLKRHEPGCIGRRKLTLPNDSLRYHRGQLCCDRVPLGDIVDLCGTPVYIYSLPRALAHLARIRSAFAWANMRIHYGVRANASLTLLRGLIQDGAGIDAVSLGEIQRSLLAGANPDDVVFAGAGKTPEELAWASTQGVGWINVENPTELDMLNRLAGEISPRIALRLNPQISSQTQEYVASGHGVAKFGLTADVVEDILGRTASWPALDFAGLHVHIGSQLGDVRATQRTIRQALDLMAPHPTLHTIITGADLPASHDAQDARPDVADFADALRPLLQGRRVLLEPGRSIVADAGLLVTRVVYVKHQAGQRLIITDAGMSELPRPALYRAQHRIVPLLECDPADCEPAQVFGPVHESADQWGRDVPLPPVQPGDRLAILDTGAGGMVMASNYNQRPRPPEVVVMPDGRTWHITRERETQEDLLRGEHLF